MGVRLKAYYDEAQGVGGIKAQLRLAMLTGTPSCKAGDLPDSPEIVNKFENALVQIKAEL